MYKLYKNSNGDDNIMRFNNDGSITSFIADSSNIEYQAYLKWLEEGNTPNPYVEPPPPPEPTPAEKLAASGLTVDELKQLLGLNT